MRMNVRLLHAEALIPTRATPEAAGLDLYTVERHLLLPNQPAKIRTGIAVQVPRGHVGLVQDRSSLGRKGVRVLGGVIDSDYTGELFVVLVNTSREDVLVQPRDRIAQLLILPVPGISVVEGWDPDRDAEAVRGAAGFGSTGR